MPQVGSRLADDVTNLTTNIVELLVIMKLKSASSSFFIASRVLRVRVGGVRLQRIWKAMTYCWPKGASARPWVAMGGPSIVR